MKRALRVIILGPLIVAFLLLASLVYPLVRGLDWLTDHRSYPLSSFWHDCLDDLWNGER